MTFPEIQISVSFKGQKKTELKKISSSKDAETVFRLLFNADQIEWVEEFVMLCLNQANKVVGFYRVSKGGMTGTVADIRVMATVGLQCCANQIIVAHNHPSGNLQPSTADRNLTAKLKDALNLLDIRLLDHLIITDEGYLSFGDEGLI